MTLGGVRNQLCFFFFCLCILMASDHVVSQGCGTDCQNQDECSGNLICSTDGTCADDPAQATSLCNSSGDVSNISFPDPSQECGAACTSDAECPPELSCSDNGTCADNVDQGSTLCNSTQSPTGDSPDQSPDQGGSPHPGDSPDQGNSPDQSPAGNGSNHTHGDTGEGSCQPQSQLMGTGHSCDQSNNAACCESGTEYPQFDCSPPVSGKTSATLTLNSFQDGGDGGGASACDEQFHDDSEAVVAVSTGWFSNGDRCNKQITIFGNGQSVQATVVDECDSQHGCDEVHAFQPPCSFDIVDASMGVWEQLGVSSDDPRFGFMQITWTDA